eukprot:GHVU01086808.1.p1 GENE.GHVU01086808.1~~GHVU01086808.1.p1  ORF type:complete len:367 (-),score=70.10 GHVU01086808.1:256-1356(-)
MMAGVREALNAAGERCTDEVEARWMQEEHPLLLVAALLSPKYVSDFRRRIELSTQLTGAHMAYFVVAYFIKYISDDCEGLDAAAMRWIRGDIAQERFCTPGVLWSLLRESDDPGLRKLATLAEFVGSLPVTTADCERLFSEFSYIQSKTRNRLAPGKVYRLSQVKRHIKKQHWDKTVRKNKKKRRVLEPAERPRATDSPVSLPRRGNIVDQMSDEDEATFEREGLPAEGAGMMEQQLQEQVEPQQEHEQGHRSAPQPVLSAGNAMQVYVEMIEDEEEGQQQEEPRRNLTTDQIAAEVASMKHSTGEQFRADHPFPADDFNDTNYPQQPRQFPGLRGWKIRLGELFRQGRNLPQLPHLPELLRPFVD